MRTTLDLDEDLVRELLKTTKTKTKTEAIHLAISELIRRRKLDTLKALSGRVRIDLDRRKREAVEQKHQERILRRQHGHR